MSENKKCPQCGEHNIGSRWTRNRMLKDYCRECGWVDKPHTPKKKAIRSVKTEYLDNGIHYEIFDKYGHAAVSSRTFQSKKAAEKECRDELKRHNESPDYAPCTGIVWPASVRIKGEVIRL